MNKEQVNAMFLVNLKTMRKRLNLTQTQLSSAIGVKRSLYGAWEEGRTTPIYADLIRLTDFFGVEIREFLTEKYYEQLN